MPKEIAIVDYGMGNLHSVRKALERAGARTELTSSPEVVRSAPGLVLPGVGAFAAAMTELRRRDLVEPLRFRCREGGPFLGICLGLQLLFERSEEDGEHEGLGILPGEVVRFPDPPGSGESERAWKVPHMGWNEVRIVSPNPLLEGVPDGARFYFVHSYYVAPADRAVVALETEHADVPFAAMVVRGNVYASQFHPEKSQDLGAGMLANFVRL